MITKFQVVKYEMAWHMDSPREEIIGEPYVMLVDAEVAIDTLLRAIPNNLPNPTIWFEIKKQYHL